MEFKTEIFASHQQKLNEKTKQNTMSKQHTNQMKRMQSKHRLSVQYHSKIYRQIS